MTQSSHWLLEFEKQLSYVHSLLLPKVMHLLTIAIGWTSGWIGSPTQGLSFSDELMGLTTNHGVSFMHFLRGLNDLADNLFKQGVQQHYNMYGDVIP